MLYVTGLTGGLGRAIAAMCRDSPAGQERVDVCDAASLRKAFDRARPDVVIHTAYRQDDDTVTRDGAAVVAAEAARIGARLIHLSSDVVFNGRLGRPLTEDDPPDASAGYGLAKREAEQLVAAACPDALIVRTSLLLGAPGAPLKHEHAARDPANVFFTDEIRSPLSVHDLAAALLELAVLDVAGVLHVGGADGLTRHELATLIAGREVRGAPGPPERPKACALDSSRARGLLRTRVRGARELY